MESIDERIKKLEADVLRLSTERAAHFERAQVYKGNLEVADRVIGALRSQVDSLEADVAALNDGWEATKAELEIERRRPVGERENHEDDKPEYMPVFADCPQEAFARGVEAGIDWLCAQSSGRCSGPEAYRGEVARGRLTKKAAASEAKLARVKALVPKWRARDWAEHVSDCADELEDALGDPPLEAPPASIRPV